MSIDGTVAPDPDPAREPEPGHWHAPDGARPHEPSADPGPGAFAPERPAASPYAAPPVSGWSTAQDLPRPYPPPPTGTDGVSIAALVTGVLGLGIVPLVLGILGVRRTKQAGTQGRGLAIAGIVLGALEILGAAIVAIVVVIGTSTSNDHLQDLRVDCTGGDMASCDQLYRDSPVGSDDEELGWTCGGATEGGGGCELRADPAGERPFAYGDDAELDALWDSCAQTHGQACDDLYLAAPSGSEYEEFGETCGGQTTRDGLCAGELSTPDAGGGYGSDPDLDPLWDACAAGSGVACDLLYGVSPRGSAYEEFGDTCGGTTDGSGSCVEERATDGVGDRGSDAGLDTLWDQCEAGSGVSCDVLFWEAPSDTSYEEFGETCGHRFDGSGRCSAELGS